jgi:hypothetical protein
MPQHFAGEPKELLALEWIALFYWKIGHEWGEMLRDEWQRWLAAMMGEGIETTNLEGFDQAGGKYTHLTSWRRNLEARQLGGEIRLPDPDQWEFVHEYLQLQGKAWMAVEMGLHERRCFNLANRRRKKHGHRRGPLRWYISKANAWSATDGEFYELEIAKRRGEVLSIEQYRRLAELHEQREETA